MDSTYEVRPSSIKLNTLKDKILFFFSLAVLLCSFGAIIYYICGPSRGFLHSDCTDSLYWANASLESGRLIADNFRYAALLPFSANLWMMPLIKIFGFGMTAQISSMVIFAVLYLASLLWVFRTLRFSWTMTFSSSAVILMLLSASVKLREIMWEHVIYYSLSLLFFNCLIALSLLTLKAWENFKKEKNGKTKRGFFIYSAILCVFTLCVSTNGLPVIVMTTLPLFLAFAAELFFDAKRRVFCIDNLPKLSIAGVALVFSAIGFAVLFLIKGDAWADYTNVYSTFCSASEWGSHLLAFPRSLASLLGFTDKSLSFLSFDGIVNILVICIFAVLLLTPVIALFFYKKVRGFGTKIVLLAHTFLLAVILFMFVFGNISNANWRLTPVIGTAAIATLALCNELISIHKRNKNADRSNQSGSLPLRVTAIVMSVLTLFSCTVFYKIVKIPADHGKYNTLHMLVAELEENGLEYGYATFWNSQAITVLSDSRIKCREILANSENGAKTDYYQSCYDWYEPQEGVEQYFVLLSQSEYWEVRRNSTWKQWEAEQLVKEIPLLEGGYTAFVFNGYLEGIK